MNTFVIIPMFNHYNLTHKCLYDVYQYTPIDTQVVVIDDASTVTESSGGIKWWQDGPLKDRLRYFRNPTNLGFGGALNKGAKIAINNGADVICLLSNDVLVYGDFVTDVVTKIERTKNILIGGEIVDFYSGWNDIDGTFAPYNNGWFIACHTDIWQKIGGFDPQLSPFDAEDLDISVTALSLGIGLVAMPPKMFRHLGGQTIKDLGIDRQEITKVNIAKFKAKWTGKVEFLRHCSLSKQEVTCNGDNG